MVVKNIQEMSSINCLNGHRKNSFCEWYSHSDECFQRGNSGVFHINSDLYREEKAFWEPIAMLCRNLMQEATNHSTQGLFSYNTSQRKGPFPFQIAAIFTPTLTQHQWLTKSGSSCPSVFTPITVYKFTSLLLPVWLMLVTMAVLLFTRQIYPSPFSMICWLTSSTFYWLSLMGQLPGVLTGLWNVTAFSLLFIWEIGAWKVYFKAMICKKKGNASFAQSPYHEIHRTIDFLLSVSTDTLQRQRFQHNPVLATIIFNYIM